MSDVTAALDPSENLRMEGCGRHCGTEEIHSAASVRLASFCPTYGSWWDSFVGMEMRWTSGFRYATAESPARATISP